MLKKRNFSKAMLGMGTLIQIHVVTDGSESGESEREAYAAIDKAFDVFRFVEAACSRFDETSEVRRLCQRVGEKVPVSPVLYQALNFALEVAVYTNGRFDPTIGRTLEALGFDRHYMSGEAVASGVQETGVTYRDVLLDETAGTVLVKRPLQLDLGAVAKGLAIDLAAQELRHFAGSLVYAGGDLYASGRNEFDEPWTIGIQHPMEQHSVIRQIQVSDRAVCTSGSYERKSPVQSGTHHIVDAISIRSTPHLVSCTAVGPFAMLADAFSTVAFLYGADDGLSFLQEVGLEGLMITDKLEMKQTARFGEYGEGVSTWQSE